jgi:hypothetical protein
MTNLCTSYCSSGITGAIRVPLMGNSVKWKDWTCKYHFVTLAAETFPVPWHRAPILNRPSHQ